jgi:hypothetical protein
MEDRLKRLLLLAGLLALVATPLAAHDIITTKLTYTRDITRIFERRCLSCHSANPSIPLTSYEEVRPWAVAIKEQVLTRAMPPWGAVKGFGDLFPDDALTQDEMLIIAAWAVGGAPRGNPAFLPTKTNSTAPPSYEQVSSALVVSTRRVLTKPFIATGVSPQPEKPVESVRIVARLPNGRIEPLLWLYHYEPKWQRVFRFRKPLRLPRGTEIEATAPLQYQLEGPATAPSRAE